MVREQLSIAAIGTIRPATEEDLDPIIALEQRCFKFPWPDAAFSQELKNAWSTTEVVEQEDGSIVAFMVYWIVEDELHLLDIAVDPSIQCRGLGHALMRHLEHICETDDLCFITLEVRVSNEAAVHLYRRMGYDVIHRRKKYYVDDGEDALVMAKVLT